MKPEGVRHDRGAHYAYHNEEGAAGNVGRDRADDELIEIRPDSQELVEETYGYHRNEDHEEVLYDAEAIARQRKENYDIQRSEDAGVEKGDPEEDVQRDDRSEVFRQVGCCDGDLGPQPIRNYASPGLERNPDQLREAVPGRDSQLAREVLEHHGEGAGHPDGPDQGV